MPDDNEIKRAALLLLDRYAQRDFDQMRCVIRINREEWHFPFHFTLGASVRDVLRAAGFKWTDQEFDNQWAQVVERAVALERPTK